MGPLVNVYGAVSVFTCKFHVPDMRSRKKLRFWHSMAVRKLIASLSLEFAGTLFTNEWRAP